MKVLLFSTAYFPFIGGAELAAKEITDRLPEIEFDLITSRLKRSLPEFERIGNVNVYRIGAGNKIFDKPLLANLGFLKALNLYKKNKYDLIHGIMASQGSAAAYLFKFIHPKVPFILTLQEGDLGGNSPFDRFWQKRVVKKADAITVISSYLADFAKKLNKKAPIFVVPNGVDLQKFKSKSEKAETGAEKVIITVSRLVRKNGIDILIKAFKILLTKFYLLNSKLLIIGDGKEKKKLESLVKKLELENKIKFLGSISNEQIPEYLTRADVFVRPSRSEGLGSAFLEAMAASVPVIATPVGGIPDFLRDPSTGSGQATGLFCETENPEDLSQKITKILTDQNLRAKIIKNSLELVSEKYNWDFIAREMKEIYEKTVSHNSSL